MQQLHPVPALAWVSVTAATLITSAAVATQHWSEITGSDNSGLLYPLLAAIIPVFTWLAAGIITAICLTRRTRARQTAGTLLQGWVKRVTVSFAWLLTLLLLAVLTTGLLWFAADLWITHTTNTSYSGAGNEFTFPRTLAVVFGIVLAPALTAAVPAVVLTASDEPDDEN